jgi:hypothetical protein
MAGVRFPAGARDFFLTPLCPVKPLIKKEPVILSSRVKWLGREAGHSPQLSIEVKNRGDNIHFPIRLHVVVLN